jgi:hypothetical protein
MLFYGQTVWRTTAVSCNGGINNEKPCPHPIYALCESPYLRIIFIAVKYAIYTRIATICTCTDGYGVAPLYGFYFGGLRPIKQGYWLALMAMQETLLRRNTDLLCCTAGFFTL